MCQMSVILEHNGRQEAVAENASLLEVAEDGVRVSTLFEEPRLLKGARIKKIDFLGGAVTLVAGNGER